MARRRLTARLEADAVNKRTLKQHEKEKMHAAETKARYGRQNNSYATDSMKLGLFGESLRTSYTGRARHGGGPFMAGDMPNATGGTAVSPNRRTTVRQM